MIYPLIAAVFLALILVACGEPKPGQYPPSLYEGEKKAAKTAEEIYPADDPAAPHAKSEKELSKELSEKVYPADDPAAPHAKSDEEKTEEIKGKGTES